MSHKPEYLSALNIYCAGRRSGRKCGQIVKSNGVPVVSHTVLEHRYSRGETCFLCRHCANQAGQVEVMRENWKEEKKVLVQH